MISASKNLPDLLSPSRRKFLQISAAVMASMALPCFCQTQDFWTSPRELWLHRPESNEVIRETYWADGALVPKGYSEICKILRDIHTNEVAQYDLVTLDIAMAVSGWLKNSGVDKPIIITSGYRSPTTNAHEGGVRNSLHTLAQAIDIRIDGVSTESVTDFGKHLAMGGVGFYPNKHFTHLDRGQIRYWHG